MSNNRKMSPIFTIGLLFSVLFGIAIPSASLGVAKPGYPYPIILKGRLPIVREKVTRIRAFSFIDKAWKQIPLQIDEVNEIGDYVLEGGLPFTKDTDDGIFDLNDELVIRGQDLGDPFTQADIPSAWKAKFTKLWKVLFFNGTISYGEVLIVSTPTGHRFWNDASFKSLVAFNRTAEEVVTPLYRYEFKHSNPVLLGEVCLKPKMDKEFLILSKSSFQMIFNLPWWMPNFSLEDQDFKSSIESWQVGPIRTIIAVGVKFKAFLSLFNLHMFSELVFYENMFQIPTVIEFAYDPSKYLKPGSGLAYSITFPPGKEWSIDTNLKDLPETPPEQILEKMETAAQIPIFYAVGRRPEGSFQVKVRVDERARSVVPPPFLIRKFMFGKEPWTLTRNWLQAFSGDLGLFLDIANVRKGTYNFGLDLLLSLKPDESFQDYGLVQIEWNHIPKL